MISMKIELKIINDDGNVQLYDVTHNEVVRCSKKKCKHPVYEFGLCFKHYCISEEI